MSPSRKAVRLFNKEARFAKKKAFTDRHFLFFFKNLQRIYLWVCNRKIANLQSAHLTQPLQDC